MGRNARWPSWNCKARREVTAGELIAHCKALLAGYKVPRDIRFEDIPKTSTGKIQKFSCARVHVTELDLNLKERHD